MKSKLVMLFRDIFKAMMVATMAVVDDDGGGTTGVDHKLFLCDRCGVKKTQQETGDVVECEREEHENTLNPNPKNKCVCGIEKTLQMDPSAYADTKNKCV